MKAILDFLAHQQFLAGVVGLGVTGALMFAFRAVPKALWMLVLEALSVSLIVDSDDQVYNHLSVWLARHKHAARARRLMVAEAYNYEIGEWRWEITLGQGWHALVLGARPLFVHRHIQDPDALARAVGAGRRERLRIIAPGRSQAVIRRLIAEAKDMYLGVGLVQVFFWSQGAYQLADKRPKRGAATVFLPPAQKARLLADLDAFTSAREAYAARGVPWRRGYLLEGPPGTGKTTLIHVLSGHIDRSIYVLNLNSLSGDNELITAVNAVGRDGVLVIEDIDGAKVSHDRDGGRDTSGSPAAPAIGVQGVHGVQLSFAPADEPRRGITISGLLNAIDGVTARDGRIMFITSNKPDLLDAALLRPGRVDVREHIARLDLADARAMWMAFRPDCNASEFHRLVDGRLPIAAAEMQNLLLAQDAEGAAA